MGRIGVERVGKAYRQYRSEWHRVLAWFDAKSEQSPEGQPSDCRASWVLRDVSFQIAPGEAVGIIGSNGAGKSTLLKLIAGTIQPTVGTVIVCGRVSAILELGLGFNPELTGRENAAYSAAMMGYQPHEVAERMSSIEDFAEVGEYFDAPLRTYSSGMQMRVAFAVATAWRPDILIVDEALSVGDSYFQHKSFECIRRLKAEGTTLLFVTHSLADVRALCDRALLMANGRIQKDGLPDEVVDFYNALIADRENGKLTIEQRRERDGWLTTTSGDGAVKVEKLVLADNVNVTPVRLARVGQTLRLTASLRVLRAVPSLVFGVMIRDRMGHVVWGSNTWHTRQQIEAVRAGENITIALVFDCALGSGSYGVTVALHAGDTHADSNFQWTDNILVFDVANTEHPVFIGSTHLNASFEIVK